MGQQRNFRDPNLVTFYFDELTHFFRLNEEHFTFHLLYKHSATFANRRYEELSHSKKTENVRPHYSQSRRENATPSSGTSPLASHKEVRPPPRQFSNKTVPTANSRRRSQLPCPNIKSITLSFPLARSISRLFSNSAWRPLVPNFCSNRQLENLSFYIENIRWEPLISNVQSKDVNNWKISDPFVKETIVIWSEVFFQETIVSEEHLLSSPLWKNSLIRIQNKPVFYKDWLLKGITQVKHLMDESSNFFSLAAFQIKYNLQVRPLTLD